MRAHEQQRESMVRQRRRSILRALLEHQRQLGLGGRGDLRVSRAVHEPAARGGQEPRLGGDRHTRARPRLERREQGVAERVLGAGHVSPARGEGGHEPPVRRARRQLGRRRDVGHAGGGGGMFGRTSAAPVAADGQRAAHSSAFSRLGTSIT